MQTLSPLRAIAFLTCVWSALCCANAWAADIKVQVSVPIKLVDLDPRVKKIALECEFLTAGNQSVAKQKNRCDAKNDVIVSSARTAEATLDVCRTYDEIEAINLDFDHYSCKMAFHVDGGVFTVVKEFLGGPTSPVSVKSTDGTKITSDGKFLKQVRRSQ